MVAFELKGFSGELPKINPLLLPPNGAQLAVNVRLDDGALTPLNNSKIVYSFALPSAWSADTTYSLNGQVTGADGVVYTSAINDNLDNDPAYGANSSDWTANTGPANYGTIYNWNGTWIGWLGAVNAAPGPVDTARLYVTGNGAPQMITGGVTYALAVPYPADALTATLSGQPSDWASGTSYSEGAQVTGSDGTIYTSLIDSNEGNDPAYGANANDWSSAVDGEIITEVYVYTYVTSFGEESLPSPASNAVNWQDGLTTTLTGFAAPPGGREITIIRIYRTQTGTSGTALYWIADQATTITDFVDDVAQDDFGEIIPSTNYNPPPDDLAGLIAMANGMMAAFVGNVIYFCQPWEPHAWPDEFTLTVNYPVVALACIEDLLIILTTGQPYLAVGTAPTSMQMEQLPSNMPCINANGVVNVGTAVAYPTNDGLAVIDADGTVRLVTEDLLTQQDWQELNPGTMAAGQLSGRYYASYNSASNTPIGGPAAATLIIDFTHGKVPFLSRCAVTTNAFFFNVSNGCLYYLDDDGNVNEFDPVTGTPMAMDWQSRPQAYLRPVNFGAIAITAQDTPTAEQVAAIAAAQAAAVSANAAAITAGLGAELDGDCLDAFALAGDGLEQIPAEALTISVNVYADGNLVATISDDLDDMVRLPSGFLGSQWMVEVTGTQRIERIALGTTVQEMLRLPPN